MRRQAVTATGRIERGTLHIRKRAAFTARLRTLRDGEVLVRVERQHAKHSEHQRAYYWGVCVELVSEHTGYEPEEVHELAKQMFLPKVLALTDGNGEIKGEYVIGGTTTTLNKVEYGEFVERFRRWAAMDLGVVIPDPDPDWREKT